MAIKKTEYLKFGENLFEIIPPLPSGTDRGGIIASPKESTDTVEIKLGSDGKLYAPAYPNSTDMDTSGIQAKLDEHKSDTNVHMTSAEKLKLSGIEDGANKYILPSAGSSLGGVLSGGDVTISNGVITVNDDSHNHVIGNIDNLQNTLDSNLATAKSYADSKVSGLASTTVVDNKISTHNTSTSAHSDIRKLISDLSTKVNNFLDVDDTTRDQLSEVLELIDNNKDALDSFTINYEFITVDDIDNICGTNIVLASEVMF